MVNEDKNKNINDSFFQLSIEDASNDFRQHLNQQANDRIIFSAPFGSGKTFFLKKFFENEDKYVYFHLFPINYSVNTNEDIFELIKFDILFNLLSKEVDFDYTKFNEWFTFESFIHYEPLNFIKSLVGIADKIGQNIPSELAEKLINVYESVNKEFKNFSNRVNKDDLKIAKHYLQTIIQKKGSVKEEDNITILINDLIHQLQNRGNKVVLIVDDLDRIDPEHIFRLLNIFAAHLDIHKQINKFSFNKIIFVCDIDNIRTIFSAKYGSKVDFTGYIDKFYSRDIYYFDNVNAINKEVFKIVSSIDIGYAEDETVRYLYSFQSNNLIMHTSNFLLAEFVKTKVISVRKLERLYKSFYYFNRFTNIYLLSNNQSYDADYFFVNLYSFLIYVFGNQSELLTVLNKASENKPVFYLGKINDISYQNITLKCLIGTCAAMLSLENHQYIIDNFTDNIDKTLAYTNSDLNIRISYVLKSGRLPVYNTLMSSGVYAYASKIENISSDEKAERIDLFKILSLSILKLNRYAIHL